MTSKRICGVYVKRTESVCINFVKFLSNTSCLTHQHQNNSQFEGTDAEATALKKTRNGPSKYQGPLKRIDGQ